jgi:anthranilate phosphoribosyltransferase
MTNEVLARVRRGESLSQEEMAAVFDAIMTGQWAAADLADLLIALRAKSETVAEIAGAAQALRKHMTPIRASRSGVLDTCGTGGDGSATFNISTAAALVTAAAGVPVAKHGNRSITSKSGSADVLAALGVNIEADVPTVERCLHEVGLCFCFAPQLHPAMKHVAAVRRQLGVPTIFNLLGPLCNPASAPFQLLGVGRPELRPLLASALRLLGTQRAAVVHGEDRLDEVSLGAATRVTEVSADDQQERLWQPEDFGMTRSDMAALRVDGPAASAAAIRAVLAGQRGPHRDIVVVNAAAALWTVGKSDSLTDCAALAAATIDGGQAARVLAELARVSHER